MSKLLDQIEYPADLRKLNRDQLEKVEQLFKISPYF